MVRNMGIARDLGYLSIPPGLVADLGEIDDLPPEQVVLISTGSQGEPMSALSRMANRDHNQVRVEPGDTVVLASSRVPGNESAVFRVINGLNRLGANVVHKETALVHVSGHAPAGELLYVLNMTRPSNFMPIHGEWRHLRAHAALAVASGVEPANVVLADDGVVVDLVDGRARIVGSIPAGYVYVDGRGVGDVGEQSLKDRLILGDEGFVTVVVVVDSVTGKVATHPEIFARGFSEDAAAFDEVVPLIDESLAAAGREGVSERHELQQRVRRVVGKWVSDTYRRRPMIIPVVLEV
jgi:ribonuclease J